MTAIRARCAAGGCLVALLLVAAPGSAGAQSGPAPVPASGWHMVAGQRAWKDPQGSLVIELGQRRDGAPDPAGIAITLSEAAPSRARTVLRICCMAMDRTAVQCTSDRGVGLGSSRQFVISRYGASRSPGSKLRLLNYPGIQFSFDTLGRTEQICVVPSRP